MAVRSSGHTGARAAAASSQSPARRTAAKKTAASKGTAKKGDALARSTRKSAANAGARDRPPVRTAVKSATRAPETREHVPQRPAVPSRASKGKGEPQAAKRPSGERTTSGTGAGKAGSKPLAGGRSLSRKAAARKSAPLPETRDKTPLGRGGKGTPPPGVSGAEGARNTLRKRATDATDGNTKQAVKPSRRGAGRAGAAGR